MTSIYTSFRKGTLFSPENCSFQTPFRDADLDGAPDEDAPIHTGDDEGERGIERVLIGREAMSSGVYDVAVNAFAISAPVEVTILVTAQGGVVELSNQTMVLGETCETWMSGRLDVDAQSVTPLGSETPFIVRRRIMMRHYIHQASYLKGSRILLSLSHF